MVICSEVSSDNTGYSSRGVQRDTVGGCRGGTTHIGIIRDQNKALKFYSSAINPKARRSILSLVINLHVYNCHISPFFYLSIITIYY